MGREMNGTNCQIMLAYCVHIMTRAMNLIVLIWVDHDRSNISLFFCFNP